MERQPRRIPRALPPHGALQGAGAECVGPSRPSRHPITPTRGTVDLVAWQSSGRG
ncbi:hypothetical protein FA95DRAFT_1554015 [Auriscalpium vulgare]|uniref:Uncharacterized protein n=1 Tax=Auriscalpium vulgare TaxID=40419 RepID=A0ACB8S646_9AGAM|nr:hypothetical protein FA95DRAFT_1554015 [Auriscalpium vulgare]